MFRLAPGSRRGMANNGWHGPQALASIALVRVQGSDVVPAPRAQVGGGERRGVESRGLTAGPTPGETAGRNVFARDPQDRRRDVSRLQATARPRALASMEPRPSATSTYRQKHTGGPAGRQATPRRGIAFIP